MTDLDLIRYVDAQAPIFESVVKELRAGRKTSHWMWFIFPQLTDLGRSSKAQYFGIQNLEQARRYLLDPLLGDRLMECVRIMLSHEHKSAHEILGSPDDYKFRSCITLFREVVEESQDTTLFTCALDKFYEGKADLGTMKLLDNLEGGESSFPVVEKVTSD